MWQKFHASYCLPGQFRDKLKKNWGEAPLVRGFAWRKLSENLLDFIRVAMVWLSDHRTEEVLMTCRGTALFVRHKEATAVRTALVVSLVTALALVFTSFSAMAQSTAGRVLGIIADQSGAAVAGATVIVTDTQRGASRTLTT